MSRSGRRSSPAVLIAALIAVAVTTLWQRSDDAPVPRSVPRAERAAPAARTETQSTDRATSPARRESANRVDAVVRSDEERDALTKTLALIDRNGPFPYPGKDGSTFANREGRLPSRPRGYYREYTVPTAGVSHRGARRVVSGEEGERWYTRDHYRTFTRIDR